MITTHTITAKEALQKPAAMIVVYRQCRAARSAGRLCKAGHHQLEPDPAEMVLFLDIRMVLDGKASPRL